MTKETQILIVFLLIGLIVALSFGGYNVWVSNQLMKTSPEELIWRHSAGIEHEVGQIRGEVRAYSKDETARRKEISDLKDKIAEINGRFDGMYAFFQKHSPKEYEKDMRDIKMNINSFMEKYDKNKHQSELTRYFDERYAYKSTVEGLPSVFEWKQLIEKINKLEQKNESEPAVQQQ